MLALLVRRFAYSIVVLLVASFVTFMSCRLTFDPLVKFAQSKDPLAKAREAKRLGLDRPLIEQYWTWLRGVFRGDLGRSWRTNDEVWAMITRALGFTVQLIIWGILVAALLSIAIGVISAVRQYSVADYTLSSVSYLGLAMPPTVFGLLAIQFLGVWLKDQFDLDRPIFFFIGLHSTGESGINLDYLRHLVLPVLTLTVQIITSWSRFQRSSMLDVLSADYVRTARAKGVRRRKVIMRHALRNALIPVMTVMAIDAAVLFGGLLVTEATFSVPGMGRLLLQALESGDAPVLTAAVMVSAVFVIVFNLLADLLYAVLDPRVRVA